MTPHPRICRWLALAGLAASAALPASRAAANPDIFDVPAPALQAGTWINTPGGKPVTLSSLRGKVVILHFWTFGCINCKHNLPIYARWQQRYRGKQVAMLGVHTPETDAEKVTANVIRESKALGVTFPSLVDTKAANWQRWGLRYWPTVFLIDKKGHVRYRWEGELEYERAGGETQMAQLVDELLAER